MKTKNYYRTKETQLRVANAIQDLAHMVGATLGPGGRPILIERENHPPLSTKDGVTVARAYRASGSIERVVSDAAKEVCERTVRLAGDGTTTAIVLAADLVKEGHVFLDANPSYSPQRLARELKATYQEKIKPAVLKFSKPISGLPESEAEVAIRHVALVSANHDTEIADAVAKAVSLVGEDGMVMAEEGAGAETRVEYNEGFPFMSGLHDLGPAAGPSFVNRQDYGDCSVDTGAFVALYDGEINDVATVQGLMEKVVMLKDEHGHQVQIALIVFAHRFSDIVLKTFAQNFRRGILTVIPVITPRNGQSVGRSQFLHDLAAYCDGTVFDAQ